nr:DUF4358 domain-containing protein [Tissierella sp.]
MKKKLSVLLLALMSISLLIACSPKDNGDGGKGEEVKDVDIKAVHSAVKEEYGEDYIPSMELTLDDLVARTKVNKDNVEEFIAEVPMMSTHVDEFIAVKAVEGKGEEVAKALEAYRDYLNENSLQYPMNIAKVKAAKVIRHGDYAFFTMLGKFDQAEDQSEEDALKFAEAENKRAEDAINGFFK